MAAVRRVLPSCGKKRVGWSGSVTITTAKAKFRVRFSTISSVISRLGEYFFPQRRVATFFQPFRPLIFLSRLIFRRKSRFETTRICQCELFFPRPGQGNSSFLGPRNMSMCWCTMEMFLVGNILEVVTGNSCFIRQSFSFPIAEFCRFCWSRK